MELQQNVKVTVLGEKYIDMKATATVAFLIECSKECRKLALSDGIE